MALSTGLALGQIVKAPEINKIFKCSTFGGMNRSIETNSLVLVSNHVKSINEDRWIGDVFHYTGMGQEGDQSITKSQNKTLAESGTNGVEVHLFEVDVETEYRYQGQVVLAGQPYTETQPDKNGVNRQVFVFPLKLLSGEPTPIEESRFKETEVIRERKAKRLSDEELKKRAALAPKKAGERTVTGTQHERNPYVAQIAKRRANGICMLCKSPAPFSNDSGEPYLETHHIEWMAKGGEDTVENTVALCPNCHRRMHVLDDENDKIKLRRVV